jgi:hypothetical protein
VIRQIAALALIFVCTTVAWMILGATTFSRTYSSNQQLAGHVTSTWGSPQEQSPPTACYKKIEITPVTELSAGKTITRDEKSVRYLPLPLDASTIDVKKDCSGTALTSWFSRATTNFATTLRNRR